MVFEHFLLGFHNFMVTALGSCVNWPNAHAFVYFISQRPLIIPLTIKDCLRSKVTDGSSMQHFLVYLALIGWVLQID